MFRSRLLAAAAGICVALVAASPAPAQEPFYKGKRLTLLVNFDAGSATDIDARVFARHFIKHIDGAPQLIIQNMPGGGGANGTHVPRRGRAQGRHDGGLPHRHRLEFRRRAGALPRRLQDLRARRLHRRHRGLLHAQGCAARHQQADRHREGARAGVGRRQCPHRPRHLDPADARYRSACRSVMSPATAAASARGSRCSARKSISMPTPRPAIAARSRGRW